MRFFLQVFVPGLLVLLLGTASIYSQTPGPPVEGNLLPPIGSGGVQVASALPAPVSNAGASGVPVSAPVPGEPPVTAVPTLATAQAALQQKNLELQLAQADAASDAAMQKKIDL